MSRDTDMRALFQYRTSTQNAYVKISKIAIKDFNLLSSTQYPQSCNCYFYLIALPWESETYSTVFIHRISSSFIRNCVSHRNDYAGSIDQY